LHHDIPNFWWYSSTPPWTSDVSAVWRYSIYIGCCPPVHRRCRRLTPRTTFLIVVSYYAPLERSSVMIKAHRGIMIWYASALHLTWAIIVTANQTALNTTALHGIYIVFGRVAAPILFIAAALPIIALYFVKRRLLSVILMLPQQSLLCISAFIALRAIYLSQFPDGVVRSSWFIATDQAPSIIAAVFYSVAIIQAAWDHKS
jgi:hypothetical protein